MSAPAGTPRSSRPCRRSGATCSPRRAAQRLRLRHLDEPRLRAGRRRLQRRRSLAGGRRRARTRLVGGDTNGVDDVFVIDLPDLLDADNDTMDDRWETLFGVTDPAADPDGDGQTNAQEEDAGTHPNGQVRRFLAEGATGSVLPHDASPWPIPSPTLAATAVLTFDRGDGTRVRRPICVAGRPLGGGRRRRRGRPGGRGRLDDRRERPPARRRALDDLGHVGRARSTARTPRRRRPRRRRRGSSPKARPCSASTCSTCCRTRRRPTTHATVRFLLPSGTTITRTYNLRAGQPHHDLREPGRRARTRPTSRATSPPTRRSSSSGRCTGACPGQPFALGHRLDGRTGGGDVVVPGRGRDRRVLRSLRADRQSGQHRRDGAGATTPARTAAS